MNRPHEYLTDYFELVRNADVPIAVIDQLKRVIVDTVGCALAGLDTPMGQSMVALGECFADPEGTVIIGTDLCVSPLLAAAVNGSLMNVIDADDGHRTAKGHPSGVILAAAMAATHLSPASGEDFLRAIFCGYEVGIRVGQAKNRGNTYHGSGYWAAFGASVAAGYLLGLSSEQMIHALGITEILAPNCQLMGWIGARDIPMIKEGMGWGASTGLMAALMAQKGVTGTLTIFNDAEPQLNLHRLGIDYEVLKLYFKKYPSCRWTHTALEAIFSLLSDNKVDSCKIEKIHIKTFIRAALLDNPRPTTQEAAQYSIPFLVAVALTKGTLNPDDMVGNALKDHNVISLADKISVSHDPEFEKQYPDFALASVEVTLLNGESFCKRAQTTIGDWNDPLSDGELKEKFYNFARRRLSPEKLEKIIAETDRLKTLPDFGTYMSLLKAPRLRIESNITGHL
jgi:2-methylcitrate dehydratase PrpD